MCSRPYGPRHAPHPLRRRHEAQHQLFCGVLCAGPHHGPGRHLPRGDGPLPGGRDDPPLPRPPDDPRHWRLRPRVLQRDVGAHLHRRRQRHGGAGRDPPPGPRVRAVPPDRHLRRGLPHHRGVPRRGWHPPKQRGRALHGEVRPHRQGPRLPGRGLEVDDDGDPRGPRRRPGEGPHLPPPQPPPPGAPRPAPPWNLRDCGDLRRC
mmetsp:Transcript_6041/g.14631  ORF Transcript_6041/g.14631 Transcript_6041/m.14631 type:complete len:205 (+) Transcript_6041:592-1206(+)